MMLLFVIIIKSTKRTIAPLLNVINMIECWDSRIIMTELLLEGKSVFLCSPSIKNPIK